MINCQNLLLTESLNSKLICNVDECLSYIIVLLNLLTIFYLVYSSYAKVTKIMRLFGYVWSCIIMCASVVVLFIHTCIFTMMCTVFTGMAIIAVLSMVFEAKKEEKLAKKQTSADDFVFEKKSEGCYVVYKTDDDKFVFALHSKSKKLILRSVYKYNSIEEAKKAILKCREYGSIAELENSTGNWVLDVNHPKFRLYLKDGFYYVDLAIDENIVMLKSKPVEFYGDIRVYAESAVKSIGTDVLYFARGKNNIFNGKEFLEEKAPTDLTTSTKKT